MQHLNRRDRSIGLLALSFGLAISQASCVVEDPFEQPAAPCVKSSGGMSGFGPIISEAQPLSLELRGTSTESTWGSSRGLALDGDQLYVADTDNGTVVTVNRTMMQVVATRHVGGQPTHMVVGPDHALYVSLRHGGKVLRFGPNETEPTDGGWAVGTEPLGMALDSDGKHLAVVVAGEQHVKLLDAQTGALLATAITGDRPIAVAINSAGLLLVTHRMDQPRYYEIDEILTTSKPSIGKETPLNADRTSTDCLPVGKDSSIQVPIRGVAASVDPASGDFAVAHVVASPGTPADSIFATQLEVQGSAEQTEEDRCAQLGGVSGDSAAPSGGYGGGSQGNNFNFCTDPIRPIDPSVSRIRPNASGWPFIPDNPQGLGLFRRDGQPLAALFDQPSDIAHHPQLAVILTTGAGSDNVLISAEVGYGTLPIGLIDVGQAPRAIVISPDGALAYVLNGHSFTVSEIALNLPQAGEVAEPLLRKAKRSVVFGIDPLPVEARLGRRTFTFARNPGLSRDGIFACATCHLDGAEDKLTWFVAGGPRQTPALAGRLQGTGPFNWLGSHNELQNNMKDTIARMGGKGLSKPELVSLEKFLHVGLLPPPHPRAGQPLSEAEARGKALFFDPEVGCSSCHVAGTETDGQLHNVGTTNDTDTAIAMLHGNMGNVRFNTPSLRGLFATAPYLHDGTAATLTDVLSRTSGTMGGVTTEAQRADLVAYMLTL